MIYFCENDQYKEKKNILGDGMMCRHCQPTDDASVQRGGTMKTANITHIASVSMLVNLHYFSSKLKPSTSIPMTYLIR